MGGKRLTKDERDQILQAYLSGDTKTADDMAAERGLSPWYAYKLANQSGLLPITRWDTGKHA